MRRVRHFLGLVVAWMALSSTHAQTLWPGTSAGMALEEVQRLFPAAIEPAEPMGLPRGRGVELLQIPKLTIAGRNFAVHFFFKDRQLVHVALTDTGIIDFKDFEKVRDVMRKRYNLEQTTTSGQNIVITWKIAQTTILLSWTPHGRDVATLAVSYDAPILRDAERL